MASTGPRPIGRGDETSFADIAGYGAVLQRGRARSGAEIALSLVFRGQIRNGEIANACKTGALAESPCPVLTSLIVCQ